MSENKMSLNCMPHLSTTSSLDQLIETNRKLKTNLKQCKQFLKLFFKYRYHLMKYLVGCKCQKIVNKSAIFKLEEVYNLLTNPSVVLTAANNQLKTQTNNVVERVSGVDPNQTTAGNQFVDKKTHNFIYNVIDKKEIKFVPEEDNGIDFKQESDDYQLNSDNNSLPEEAVQLDQSLSKIEQKTVPEQTTEVVNESTSGVFIDINENSNENKVQINFNGTGEEVDPNPEEYDNNSDFFDDNYLSDKTDEIEPSMDTTDPGFEPIDENNELIEEIRDSDSNWSDKSERSERITRKQFREKIHICHYKRCDRKYTTKKALRQHHRVFHRTFKCSVCDKTFDNKEIFQIHERVAHKEDQVFVCNWPGCETTYANKKSFREHTQRHLNQKQYKCDQNGCQKAYNTSGDLRKHKMTNHYKLGLPCRWTGCTELCDNQDAMTKHTQTVHMYCQECELSFKHKTSFLSHKRLVHGDLTVDPDFQKFLCPTEGCLRAFSTKLHLEQHINANHSDNPILYSCEFPECGQTFKTMQSFASHRLKHGRVGQYKCTVDGCNKSFMRSSGLKRHSLKHSTKVSCSWPGCESTFNCTYQLNLHLGTHQQIRSYKCQFPGCDQSFLQNGNLTAHMNSSHKKVRYYCDFKGCTKSYVRKYLLDQHMNAIHFQMTEDVVSK